MKLRLLMILGWLLFCFLFLVFIKLILAGSLEAFYFYWNAVLWLFIDCLIGAGLVVLLKRGLALFSDDLDRAGRDFLILIATIPIIAVVLTAERILILETVLFPKPHTLFHWVRDYLVNFVIQTVVTFSCVSYFYITALDRAQQKLLRAERAQGEAQLKLLHQQVNPHFLFNNLNVLSSLIDKDPVAANRFLEKLSDLYRYILATQTLDLVKVEAELEFARNYLYLIELRYSKAYEFIWDVPESTINGHMMVPATLQSLIENVVKHNRVSQREPLSVRIVSDGRSIAVEHELRRKAAEARSGTGLECLCARYALLTKEPVEVSDTGGRFRVKVPLLRVEE